VREFNALEQLRREPLLDDFDCGKAFAVTCSITPSDCFEGGPLDSKTALLGRSS